MGFRSNGFNLFWFLTSFVSIYDTSNRHRNEKPNKVEILESILTYNISTVTPDFDTDKSGNET